MCGKACACGNPQGTCARDASTSAAAASEDAFRDGPIVLGAEASDRFRAIMAAPTLEPPAAGTLNAKLADFDRRSEQAFDWMIAFLQDHRDELQTIARARHITGHYVYGDSKMYAYDRGRLAKEILEEGADAIVYAARRLAL